MPALFHHPSQKSGVWTSLVARAVHLSSEQQYLDKEIEILKEIAMVNGYAPDVVDSALSKIRVKESRQRGITLQPEREGLREYCVLPYVGPASSRVGSILSKCVKKQIAFLPLNKLGEVLFNTKDELEAGNMSGIYKIYCGCGMVYVGQTRRNFSKRLSEHKAAVKNFVPEASAVARHFWRVGCEEGFDWESSKVVLTARHNQGNSCRELLEIALENKFNQHGVMNDIESLGRVQLWMSLSGSFLRPSGGPRCTVVSNEDQTIQEHLPDFDISVDSTFQGQASSVEGSQHSSRKDWLPVRSISLLQDADLPETPQEQAKNSPWSNRLRPRK